VIHCHYGPIGLLGVALRELGLIQGQLVTSFYGYDVTRHPDHRGSRVYDRLFQQAELILALSSDMRERLIQLGCSENKCRVHHLGVDVSRFTYRTPTIGNRPLKLISVARLVEKKGLANAISALAAVRDSGIPFEYQIVGGGPLAETLQAQVSALDLTQHVQLLGWRVQEEIAELLESADVFVAPSVRATDGDEEGTPTAIIEAMAMGLPVLSTVHSGIPEVVRDGQTGYLVPEHDVAALVDDRIQKLHDDRSLLLSMGRAGREVIESEFDVAKLNDELIQHYGEIA
jgi:colanic acid/amylovoran biosynthesis glycosyltransferase